MLRLVAWMAGVWLFGLIATTATAACTGDCNGDAEVTIDEVIRGVNLALEVLPISACPSFDANGDAAVTIDELVAAVNAALFGCPPASTATPTLPLQTPTATATPSATNAPPVLTPLPIYRTFPGYPIALPLPVVDPEGQPLQCSAGALPMGAHFDDQSQTFEWTPSNDQLGPFYVPFSCTDPASNSVAGSLVFKVQALDRCGTPVCDPASGCTQPLPALDTTCCADGPLARVAEPSADCPEALVVFVGDNQDAGFGRLQNCDRKRVLNMAQSAAQVRFHVQARCISHDDRARFRARLETAKRVLFDQEYRISPTPAADGFDERLGIPFSVDRLTTLPDFTDIEGAEANLTVTLRDARNVTVTETLRLLLTFTPVADLPDVDPTPTQAPN
ncbi:MAG: hypothetical protein HY270_06760 [Deltaproteobacteria bacterium]|nr:hypothetical protein [Deltaproteobacteria bacterium]